MASDARVDAGAVTLLPAVMGRDWRSPGNPLHPRLQRSNGLPLNETLGVYLSPEICEWVMGFPPGWSELPPKDPSASDALWPLGTATRP